MATRADFSDDEWKRVMGALPMIGLAVASASPNGPLGVMKEMMSIGMALADVLKTGSSNALINAIIDDAKARTTRQEAPKGIGSPEEMMASAIAHVQNASTLIDGKCSPTEAKEFKQWLLGIAHRVAEASSEGGFFGIGGVRVSESEKAVLGKLAIALGLPAA